ncbi:MAG: hypothetical protein ACI8RD_014252 [Bacillariaceae sp.]|jgi:hypothetical protein
MVHQHHLQKECSTFLTDDVMHVGIFDVSLNFAERTLAPAAAGLATYAGTRFIEKETHTGDTGIGGEVVAAGLGVAAAAGTRHLIYIHEAEKMGVTPIMIVAVTENNIFLLDWVGNHEKGHGPTRILFEFSKHDAKIKTHTHMFVHHTIDVHEYGHHAKVCCSLSATHANKAMNRGVLHHLKEGSD